MWLRWHRLRLCLATALLVALGLRASVNAVLGEWRLAASNRDEVDVVTRGAQLYEPLISSLPLQGTVGYLQPSDWPGNDAVLRFYLAEYALTPRIVVMGTLPEFVIVVPEAAPDAGERLGGVSRDSRLAGFVLYARFPNGLRIFRRVE